MTNIQPIIDDLTNVRERIAGLKFDHTWDARIRDNTIPRLDAALSDLRVVACRMREDGPCNCDTLDEPVEWLISEQCDSLDNETKQAQQAAVVAASVLTNPTPETREAWVEARESCGINPEFVTITMADGTTRSLTDKEREQLFGAKSLRADVVERFTTDGATVIDRADGTRTTVKLDGTLTIEPQPITESLMRAAQVGWVVRTKAGGNGVVEHTTAKWLRAKVKGYGHPLFYLHSNCGRLSPNHVADYDIVSLAPPEVANV